MAPSETETLRAQAARELAIAYRARDAAADRARAAETALDDWATALGRAVLRDAELTRAAETAAALLWQMPEGTPHRRAALDALLAVLPDGQDWDGGEDEDA